MLMVRIFLTLLAVTTRGVAHERAGTGRTGHRLIQIGVALFLLTSFQGFTVPYFAIPNLGRSVHTLSGFSGVTFLALGLVWPKLKLTPVTSRVAFWLFTYSAFATIRLRDRGPLGSRRFDLPDCGSRRTWQ
jgi:hypothetical protein